MVAGVVFKDAFVEINDGTTSTDISLFCRSLRLNLGRREVEDTAAGDDAETFVPGLRADAANITIKTGYGAGSPEEVISTIIENGTQISMALRPSSDPVSVDNPQFTASAGFLTGTDYSPLGANRVGDLVESQIVFRPASGATFVRTTA